MNNQIVHAEDVFKLNMISKNLSGYQPPETPFDTAGSWRHEYDVLTLVHGFGTKIGTLEIERKNKSPDTVLLTLDYQLELLGNYTHRVTAEIDSVRDTPLRMTGWRFNSVSLDPAGHEVPRTRIHKTAKFVNHTMVVHGYPKSQTIKMKGPCLVGWTVLEWVQRIGPDFKGSAEFTFIDDFDQVKPDGKLIFEGQQKIHFREAAEHACQMRCYMQTGQGVLPTAYWVDECNRCLFVVSGIEAYILRS